MDLIEIISYLKADGLKDSFFGDGFSVRKAWPWFLFGVLVLIFVNIAAGFYFFNVFVRQPSSFEPGAGELRGPRPDLEGLEKVMNVIDEKEARFEKLIAEPLLPDPSL